LSGFKRDGSKPKTFEKRSDLPNRVLDILKVTACFVVAGTETRLGYRISLPSAVITTSPVCFTFAELAGVMEMINTVTIEIVGAHDPAIGSVAFCIGFGMASSQMSRNWIRNLLRL